MSAALPAAVAAGHPATAEARAEILAAGGSAADAAVAAGLASCVAETVMTGLLGGGHAIYFDAAEGTARNLDCFVAVPSGEGAPMEATILHLPGFVADPAKHGTRSGTVIALDMSRNIVLIGGTHYAGEIKKSVF